MNPEERDQIDMSLRVAQKLVEVLRVEFPVSHGTFDVIAGIGALGMTLGLVIGDAPSQEAQMQATTAHRNGVELGLGLNKAVAAQRETEH